MPSERDRADAVLDVAMRTFSRLGYRKTSMADVARAADLSRQGLYYLFSSKERLFSAAAAKAVGDDLAEVSAALAAPGVDLRRRVVAAFDRWAGRYVGPLQDVTTVIAANPELVDAPTRSAPARFRRGLVAALVEAVPRTRADAVAQTLIDVSVGIQGRVGSRREYVAAMRTTVGLLVTTD